MRRIIAAKWCFTQLRSWLTSTVHPLTTRLKLYRQCVMATVSYGIHEMGITRRGLAKLVSMINTHHRIMTKSPVCLTHESTQSFFDRLNLMPPWIQLQQQQQRIQQALHNRATRLRLEAMTAVSPDTCVCVPDLWPSDLNMPVETPDPQLAQELTCPECHRAFHQVGALKRHMRRAHAIPCEPDDLYNPLRDAWNGRPICSHCSHSFVDFYRLRDHINRRVCISFNPAQESIIPIVARPDLKMHLCHKSIPGLLLNQALIKELSCHCAFCHCQIAARSMHKHSTDQHPMMVTHADQYQAHVLATVALSTGCGPDPQKMRTLLLELSLGNDANDRLMNTAMIGEFWACCMDNTWGIAWHLAATTHSVAGSWTQYSMAHGLWLLGIVAGWMVCFSCHGGSARCG